MADKSVTLHKLELLFALALPISAVVSVVRWNSPCCGILLMYFAVRAVLYGLLTVGV